MRQPDDSPVEARERGLQRLRAWTTASAVLAAGLALVFALLAAGTFPGRPAAAADSSSGAPGDQTQQQPSFGDPGATQAQPKPPGGGFFGSGSGSGGIRGARSGGS